MEGQERPEYRLVDARGQVKAALEEALAGSGAAVRQSWPVEAQEGIVVTYGEHQNTSTGCSVVDEVSYQVDIWAFDRETVIALSALVNRAMAAIGLKRQYSSPDEGSKTALGYEHKSFRFGRRVDKRTMRLID